MGEQAKGQERFALQSWFVEKLQNAQTKGTLRILIFSHRQADPDSLCAAFALGEILKELYRRINQNSAVELSTHIIAPQGASQLGERISRSLGIQYQESLDEQSVAKADLIAAVDVGDPKLLEPYLEWIERAEAPKIVIDHHGDQEFGKPKSVWRIFDEACINGRATSTCELIALGFSPDFLTRSSAQALVVGIMFDSQHLGIATKETLEATLDAIREGAEITLAREMLRSQPDRSEIIARIKSAQRIQHVELGKYQILKVEVSSFHASVARMLIDIGGDLGIAFGEHEGEARLSARSSHQFARETGIDLGSLFEEIAGLQGLGKEIIGGGHPTAASISGKVDASVLADSVIEKIKAKLVY